jgi:two-component system cell cycle response regulator DivK
MDVQLPIMDGYTATRRIKADPALRSITIIAVTSYALDGEEKTARAAGCDDYVPKPFSPRPLLAKIRQHLSLPVICCSTYVRFWHLPDIPTRSINVCFWG